MTTRRLLVGLAGAIVAAGTVRCSPPPPADVVLECSASDIRHVLRIRANDRQVDDLSVVPATHGDAELSDTEYLLRFLERRDRYELLFRINRVTGSGTRELIDEEEQRVPGHGGFDEISCRPYTGNP